jgi:hypothetical protein
MIEAMNKLTRDNLYSLEQYAQARPEFRQRVLAHKKNRQVPIGPNATLYFEDALTVQYQIQEMLRIERIFEAEGIKDELDAYNPLIPDGSNWKATFMVELPDVEERKRELARLIGIEDKLWMQVSGHDRVYAIADEDLERENADKTSSVHFVRFELKPEMAAAAKSGAAVSIGIDHPNYRYAVEPVQPAVRDSLAADLA